MKFDTVRPSTLVYYERMIDVFLSDKDNRFSAMIIDKQNCINRKATAFYGNRLCMGHRQETYTHNLVCLY